MKNLFALSLVLSLASPALAVPYLKQRHSASECVVRSGTVSVFNTGTISTESSTVDAVVTCPITVTTRADFGEGAFDFTELSLLQAYTSGTAGGVECRLHMNTATTSLTTPLAPSTAGTMTDLLVAGGEELLTTDQYTPMTAALFCTLKKNSWPKNQLAGWVVGFIAP